MIMPSDFVVGDVEVDEHGSLPGQVLPDDDDQVNHNGNANEIGDTGEPSASASGLGGDADASDGGDGGERVRDVAAIEVEADDPAIGFEYDGEVKIYIAVLKFYLIGVLICFSAWFSLCF